MGLDLLGIEEARRFSRADQLSGWEYRTINDDFENVTDGLPPCSAPYGYVLTPSGTGAPRIASGRLGNSVHGSNGYTMANLYSDPVEIGAEISFVAGGGGGNSSCVLILSKEDQTITNAIHVIFGQTGITFQKRVASVATTIATQAYTVAFDGTKYSVALRKTGANTVRCFLPDGTTFDVTDASIGAYWGRFVQWETAETASDRYPRFDSVYVTETRNPLARKANDVWTPNGAFDETFPRLNLTGVTIATGVLYLMGGKTIPAGKPVRALGFESGATAGSGLTHQWACLIDQSLRVVAKSADYTTDAWAASTHKKFPFTSAWTPDRDTPVYAGLMVTASTTMPNICGYSAGAIGAQSKLPMISGHGGTGYTDPASLGATISSVSTTLPQLYAEFF